MESADGVIDTGLVESGRICEDKINESPRILTMHGLHYQRDYRCRSDRRNRLHLTHPKPQSYEPQ